MQAIRELYKTGRGPSSSHTLAPERACRLFVEKFGPYPYYEAELFGSLSLTGRGHHTDQIIQETLPGECRVLYSLEWKESFPNGFYLRAFDADHVLVHQWTVFSLGGGSIQIKEFPLDWNDEVYSETTLKEVYAVCEKNGWTLADYVYDHEPDLKPYLKNILHDMIECVEHGLHTEGLLPGKLNMERSASRLFAEAQKASEKEQARLKLMSYAYAASEENAAGHTCVTAPTLGACGVMAAGMYYELKDQHRNEDELVDALAAGGVFGNIIKSRASISGAVGGCQAEVGTAVSMMAAAASVLEHLDAFQIEYAAEIAMEHNLGLTCDPVMGYVMIPCIERNAMGVLRSYDAMVLSKYMSRIRRHLISFDMVVDTMKETGKQIPIELKETAEGGLAWEYEHEN